MIGQRLLYETLVRTKQRSNFDRCCYLYRGSWLKEHPISITKSPKVICRAVHDATLNNTTRELKNSVVLLYFFITDSNC
jgi:hypothetical protein